MSVQTSNLFPERLYLSKGGEGDIYINNSKSLWKNQIDGLRGIYRIFKKKNPGVILNDASNCGKTVLVSLFIGSIQSLLDNPVLVLCNNEQEIEHWKEVLLNWTRFTKDNIAINSTNPYLRKNIFIQSMDLSNSFYRRRWSILILKNDEITKEISKMVFDAEFRIWITSVDVFKDLNMLSGVGKFINPNLHINTADFQIQNKKLPEKVKTLVLLENFTKDFVVRTDHLKSVLRTTKNDTNKAVLNSRTTKNKDATGTKIKKSKRKMSDEESRKSNKKVASKEIKTKATKEMEIKLNNVDPENASEEAFSSLNISLMNISPSLISLTFHRKSSELKDTQNCIDGNLKTNEANKDNNATSLNQSNMLVEDTKLVNDEDSTQSLTDMSGKAANVDNETVSQIKSDNTEDKEMSPKLIIEDIFKNNNLDHVVTNEIESEMKSDDIYEKETVDLGDDTSQIKLNYSEDVKMELGDEISEVDSKVELENNKNKSESINATISNELVLKSDEIPNSVANTQTTENIKENTLDKKLNDLEMKTLMKFKGSFLDRLF